MCDQIKCAYIKSTIPVMINMSLETALSCLEEANGKYDDLSPNFIDNLVYYGDIMQLDSNVFFTCRDYEFSSPLSNYHGLTTGFTYKEDGIIMYIIMNIRVR